MTATFLLNIFFLLLPIALSGSQKLILDTKGPSSVMPDHFRRMSDPIPSSHNKSLPSKAGLDTLPASGSGQYSEKGFKQVIKKLKGPKHLIILDVRRESHGFMNGCAVSWYSKHNLGNKGIPLKEIQKNEAGQLKKALRKGSQEYIYGKPLGKKKKKIKVKDVSTEAMLASKYKVSYIRLAAPDNMKPTVANVDDFIHIVKKMPKGSRLHIHCREGLARTTTFLAMFDMMKNAKKVRIKDIIIRQKLLGGMDLMRKPNYHSWTAKYYKARSAFMRRFYNYCKDQSPNFKTKWKDWCKKKHWSNP